MVIVSLILHSRGFLTFVIVITIYFSTLFTIFTSFFFSAKFEVPPLHKSLEYCFAISVKEKQQRQSVSHIICREVSTGRTGGMRRRTNLMIMFFCDPHRDMERPSHQPTNQLQFCRREFRRNLRSLEGESYRAICNFCDPLRTGNMNMERPSNHDSATERTVVTTLLITTCGVNEKGGKDILEFAPRSAA